MTASRPLQLGLTVLQAVTGLKRRVRRYYYQVVLLGHACPSCGGTLTMHRDDRATCTACGNNIDPTIQFQRCRHCGGRLHRKTKRYHCSLCGTPAQSRFAFDPPRFDRHYYAQRMRQSRTRRRKQKEKRQERLILARSRRIQPEKKPRLDDVPGLTDALDHMAGFPIPREVLERFAAAPELDMKRYRKHIRDSIGYCEVSFNRIPPLLDDRRRDRIFRFVTCIFMCHEGEIKLMQQDDVLVIERNEPDRKG